MHLGIPRHGEEDRAKMRTTPRHVAGGSGRRRRITIVVAAAAVTAALGGSAVFLANANAAETTVPGRLQAEAYSAESGARTQGTSDSGGGRNVGWLAGGDWLRYDQVRVGGALTARIASDNPAGGTIEMRLGSASGKLLASFPVTSTGGWQKWKTVTAAVAQPPAGPQNLVAVMRSGQKADFVNINWFTLGTPPSPAGSPAVPSTAPSSASPSSAPVTTAPTTIAPTTIAPTTTKPSPAAPTTTVTAPAGGKKGVSTWKFDGVTDAIKDVGASWYYNWSPNNNDEPAPSGVEFVPMIWGKANVTDATLSQAKSEGSELLGFNEPDQGGQANMSVADALAAWPKLEATGMRLGAPAVSYGGDTAGGWLDQFMSGAKAKGYRVDFIPIHWYGSDFSAAAVGQFLGYVDAVHQRYGKPIWVTEYGLQNFTGTPKYPTTDQEVAFIKGSTAGLESRSYVERYAWFSLPAVGDSLPYGLYRDGHTPTAAGAAYKAAGAPS
jgi:hypothetical protein